MRPHLSLVRDTNPPCASGLLRNSRSACSRSAFSARLMSASECLMSPFALGAMLDVARVAGQLFQGLESFVQVDARSRGHVEYPARHLIRRGMRRQQVGGHRVVDVGGSRGSGRRRRRSWAAGRLSICVMNFASTPE